MLVLRNWYKMNDIIFNLLFYHFLIRYDNRSLIRIQFDPRQNVIDSNTTNEMKSC